METTSFKALAIQRLQGNRQGNQKETLQETKETSKETPTRYDTETNTSLLVGIRTGTGRKVYIATDDKAAKMAPEGAALFTRQEIIALADKLIDVKEVFPGAVIEKIGEAEQW